MHRTLRRYYLSPALIAFFWTAAAPAQVETAANGPSSRSISSFHRNLVLNSLTALNHAVITGNFSVLRDLASEDFRQRNDAASLALHFRLVKEKGIDLSPVLLHVPRLTQPPELTQDGRMRLIGLSPTKPMAVTFDLTFQHGSRGWAIQDINVGLLDNSTKSQHPSAPLQPVSSHRRPGSWPESRSVVPSVYTAAPHPFTWASESDSLIRQVNYRSRSVTATKQ